MLISLLLICYTLFTAYISGIVFLYIFSKAIGIKFIQRDFTFVAISGLCWIALVISIQHIFYKVGLGSHLIIWFVNGIVWFKYSEDLVPIIQYQLGVFKNKPARVYLIYALFLLGAILNIIAKPAIGDAADYHFQAIRWIEEYKVVPGVGNVRRQLGNNSNWFLLNAFFGFSFTGLRSIYVLNASIVLMACFYFSSGVEKFITGKIDKQLIIKSVILIYLMFTIFRKYVGAVTNDYVITIMVLYVFTLLLETNKDDLFPRLIFIFFIAAMITFKLSALPMLLLAVFILYSIKDILKIKQFIILCGSVLLLFIPWVYTNVINCGYLVFPITTPDLFNVDWKMRKSLLDWEVMSNLAWARVPFADIDISSKYTFNEWFPLWIKSLDGFSFFLLSSVLMLSAVILFLGFMKELRQKAALAIQKDHFYILFTSAIALYLWFTHGPTPRFVYGYLVFLFGVYLWFLSVYFPMLQVLFIKQAKHIVSLVIIVFLVLVISFLPKYFTINSFAASALFPKEYTQVRTNKLELKQGYVNIPLLDEQCWDSPLPCTTALDTTLMWRGTNIEDGFKIRGSY